MPHWSADQFGAQLDTARVAQVSQPAVSRISNPPVVAAAQALALSQLCRLEVGDTADWKSALRGAVGGRADQFAGLAFVIDFWAKLPNTG